MGTRRVNSALLSCDFGRPDEPEGLLKSEPSRLQDLLFEMLSVTAIASSRPKTWTAVVLNFVPDVTSCTAF